MYILAYPDQLDQEKGPDMIKNDKSIIRQRSTFDKTKRTNTVKSIYVCYSHMRLTRPKRHL